MTGTVLVAFKNAGALQGVDGSNPLPVSIVGDTFTVSENIAQVNGATVNVGAGNTGTGTLRVVLATDQPALTVALKVDGSGVNQPVTGTFFQATQPVSIASMPSTPVTGTFFQATQPVDGATASGVAVANPPVTMGGRAATTNPTAVADGQVVNAMLTKHGKAVTVDGTVRELKGSQKTSISNSTSEVTIITAGSAGVFNDLYGLILANTGATTTKVDVRDATLGTIILTIEVPTLETRGIMLSAGSALAQTTAANNWTAQCTAATTALEVTALFIKST